MQVKCNLRVGEEQVKNPNPGVTCCRIFFHENAERQLATKYLPHNIYRKIRIETQWQSPQI